MLEIKFKQLLKLKNNIIIKFKQVLNLSNHFARITHCHRVIWNIFYHYTPPSNHNIVTNVHSGHYLHARTYPHIIATSYRAFLLLPFLPLFLNNRISGSIKSTIRSNKYIIPKTYRSTIQNNQVMIRVKIFA